MNDYGVCVRLKTRCGLASKQEPTITDGRKDKIFPKEESEERRDGWEIARREGKRVSF
jgi:hypothetical protein